MRNDSAGDTDAQEFDLTEGEITRAFSSLDSCVESDTVESVMEVMARPPVMAAAHLQATTPSPRVTATGWALHGHVFSADLQLASKFIVSLTDDSKKIQSKFGSSQTDDIGYFLLNNPGPSSSDRLFVEVQGQSGHVAYRGTTPFSLWRAVPHFKI